jgi:hypothetical protein
MHKRSFVKKKEKKMVYLNQTRMPILPANTERRGGGGGFKLHAFTLHLRCCFNHATVVKLQVVTGGHNENKITFTLLF